MAKTVGLLNLILGIIQIVIILLLIYVSSRVQPLLNQSSLSSAPIYYGMQVVVRYVILFFGLANLFLGWKLFFRNNQKYFLIGVGSLALNILSFGILMFFGIYSIIEPIYQLTTSYS